MELQFWLEPALLAVDDGRGTAGASEEALGVPVGDVGGAVGCHGARVKFLGSGVGAGVCASATAVLLRGSAVAAGASGEALGVPAL